MSRRKEGLFEVMAKAPWPFGIATGVIGYFIIRYGIIWYLRSSGSPIFAKFGEANGGTAFAPFAWMWLGFCCIAALGSFIGRQKRKRLLETQTGLDSLRAMSWRQFEMLVGEAFRRQGYRIEETGLGGADGGIDLLLSRNGKTTLVQCKQWRSQRVDVKVVREMYGLLAHHGADAVKIVAVGDFTPDAQRFVQSKPIELIHGEALLTLIRNVQVAKPVQATRPDSNPASAEEPTPECPSCGSVMIKRSNRRTREAFWGCPKYPACRGTRTA